MDFEPFSWSGLLIMTLVVVFMPVILAAVALQPVYTLITKR